MSKHPGPDVVEGMIRDELAVGDDSFFASPEAMRSALLAVLDVPVPSRVGVRYLIAQKLDLIERSADE